MSLREELEAAWRRTDALFDTLAPEALSERPIPLRQPFVFYVGHLPAFAWNQVAKGVLGWPSLHAPLEALFERGIDPPATAVPSPPPVRERWPDLPEILAFRDAVRDGLRPALDEPRAHASGILHVALEHELMHHETLLYMVQALEPRWKRPPPMAPARAARAPAPRWVRVGGGRVALGVDPSELSFAWDNELPRHEEDVPAFELRSTPVTVGEFRRFVEAGGYRERGLWHAEAWSWRRRVGLHHPVAWRRRRGGWAVRSAYREHALEDVAAWPVFVSRAEAEAFLAWSGGRLPTEAEWQRAAWTTPGGGPEMNERGDFGASAWEPSPVGAHGANAWGACDLVGGGWEWTCSVFAGFPGFRATVPSYPGYSADFFDGRHFVLKGGAWATARRLVRPSFRNWFQPCYPWVFAKFRPARDLA